jgi:hypothetical protein
MRSTWFAASCLAAVSLFTLPISACAQGYLDQEPEHRHGGGEYRDEQQKYPIAVTNDWRDDVTVTIWRTHGERIGDSWEIPTGQTAWLEYHHEPLNVRGAYKIKVGDDWGWVNLQDVGDLSNGAWRVKVRDIWRATHSAR